MRTVTAVNYKLNLEPDLEQFTFRGAAVISLTAAEPVEEIVLNVLDIAIDGCRLLAEDSPVDCANCRRLFQATWPCTLTTRGTSTT